MNGLKKALLACSRAAAGALIFPIRVYQRVISPRIPPRCRFTPTCSAYAVTALRRFGIVRGNLLALCRIVRCQPFCRPGYDPVPLTFSLRPFEGARQEKEQAPPDAADTEDLP